MTDALIAPLCETLRCHFSMSKSRVVTLAVLICGIAQSRTVNLSHLACHFAGPALHASNYRRLQRFFQHECLDGDIAARMIVQMLNLARPKRLALDRTNWRLGGREINILMLAIVTRRFRVPLMWLQLDRSGGSDTAQRIALMRRYLALFGADSIVLLLADREFIGAQWLEFLCENNVPFAIRLREGQLIELDGGRRISFASLLRRTRHGAWEGRLSDMTTTLRFAARHAAGQERIVIATNTADPKRALRSYAQRWGVECLFADTKTRGLNLEDTHITAPGKLDTLLAIVALAVTWAYRCATTIMRRGAIRRKTHGRREKSWFRIGLDALRKWLGTAPDKAMNAWLQTVPKRVLHG